MKTSFKQFLIETPLLQSASLITNVDEAEEWVADNLNLGSPQKLGNKPKYEIELARISGVLTCIVHVDADVEFIRRSQKIKRLPIRFGRVRGDFSAIGLGLESFFGLPPLVNSIDLSNNNFSTFDTGRIEVHGNLILSENSKLKSLHNIEQVFPKVGRKIYLDDSNIKDSILGLLKIQYRLDDDLKYICLFGVFEQSEVSKIINRNIKNKSSIFDCQEELIDAGYEDLAKL